MSRLPVVAVRQYRRTVVFALALAASLLTATSCGDAPTSVAPAPPAAVAAEVNEYGIPPLDTSLYVAREHPFTSPWESGTYRCDAADSLPLLLGVDASPMCVEFIHPETDRRLSWTQLRVPVGDSLLVRCAAMDWRYPDNRVTGDWRYRWNYGNPQVATVHPVADGGVQTAWVRGFAPGTAPVKCMINNGTWGSEGYWETMGSAQVEVTGEPSRAAVIRVGPDTLQTELGQGAAWSVQVIDQYGRDNWVNPDITTWETRDTTLESGWRYGYGSEWPGGTGTWELRKVWYAPEGDTVRSNVVTHVVVRGAVARVMPSIGSSLSVYTDDAPRQLGATVYNRYWARITDVPVTWSSTDAGVVDVTADGVLTPKAPGTARVHAMADTARAVITVTVAAPVATTIAVTPSSIDTDVGLTQQLTAVVYDQRGRTMPATVAWSSADAAVAEVTTSGLLTARGAGSTSIRATSGNASATVSVKVIVPTATKVVTSPATATVAMGGTQQLTAVVYDQRNRVMTTVKPMWASMHQSVATVSQTGVVTPLTVGQASVYAYVGSIAGFATITVVAAPPPSASTCGDPLGCLPVQAAYVSHFANADCTGTEYYYTAYFNYDGKRRSWNGLGLAGKTTEKVTVKSYKLSDGGGDGTGCRRNVWGSAGYNFSGMSRIYR